MGRRLSTILAAIVSVVAVAGCGYSGDTVPEQPANPRLSVETVTMPSGAVVECVMYKAGYTGGLWCRDLDGDGDG